MTRTRRARRVDTLAADFLANPLIESWSIEEIGGAREGRRRRLPGLQLRPRRAARRASWPAPTPSCCGTRRPTCAAPTRSILPGGFAHGDYLRAGAIARFSPIMGAVRDHAARGGLVLGHLQRLPGADRGRAVPGALRRNATLRFEHRWVRCRVENALDTPFTWQIPDGTTLRMPIAHGEGNYFLPDAELDALEARRPGRRSATRRRRAIRTARRATSPASSTSAATCAG